VFVELDELTMFVMNGGRIALGPVIQPSRKDCDAQDARAASDTARIMVVHKLRR
jgi:hypothetical protein